MENYRDDFKLRFIKKPQYTIDEIKKTVKCYLTCDVIAPNGITGNKFMSNFRTFSTGYAKCDSKDTFNPEIGKKIALARAESKIYWKARTEVKMAVRDAKKFVEAGEKFILKARGVVDHNNLYIYKKFKKNDNDVNFFTENNKYNTNFKRTNFEKNFVSENKKNSIKIKINRV